MSLHLAEGSTRSGQFDGALLFGAPTCQHGGIVAYGIVALGSSAHLNAEFALG
jgi:hypothetical protein